MKPNSVLDFYERMYKLTKKKSIYGSVDKSLVKFISSSDWNKQKALDIACGDGRNTLFLASKGFSVLAIDGSKYALKKLENFIKNSPLRRNIKLKRADLRRLKLKREQFDVCICTYVLQELGVGGFKNVIKQMKFATKPAGINYIVSIVPRRNTFIRKECYYPSESELLRLYKGWRVLRKRKKITVHNHPTPYSDGKSVRHKHYVVELFLQKTESK